MESLFDSLYRANKGMQQVTGSLRSLVKNLQKCL